MTFLLPKAIYATCINNHNIKVDLGRFLSVVSTLIRCIFATPHHARAHTRTRTHTGRWLPTKTERGKCCFNNLGTSAEILVSRCCLSVCLSMTLFVRCCLLLALSRVGAPVRSWYSWKVMLLLHHQHQRQHQHPPPHHPESFIRHLSVRYGPSHITYQKKKKKKKRNDAAHCQRGRLHCSPRYLYLSLDLLLGLGLGLGLGLVLGLGFNG
jgi:hypothetical protein